MDGLRIDVSVDRQLLRLIRGGSVVREFPVSTSAFGLGTRPGSFHTPTGRFAIGEKIGAGEPPGTIFRSRTACGVWQPDGPDDGDLVLTRILRLHGLDPDNANTHERYIYIHGTNQEHLLGTPASHGCVRMSNAGVIELFDLVETGTPVEIRGQEE